MRIQNAKSIARGVAGTIATLAITACVSVTEPTQSTPSSTDMAASIAKWWQGDYNNDTQIKALVEDGAPIWQQNTVEESYTFGGHLPVNSYYRAVDLPAFGDRVIYLEEKTFKTDPYRQRIYTVIHDESSGEVHVKLWYFKDKEKYLGAWQDLSMIKDLTPDEMSPLPDSCDLYASPTDDGRIYMKMKDCQFGDRRFDYQIILGPDHFWFRDRIVDAETDIVVMTAGSFTYHKLDKVE